MADLDSLDIPDLDFSSPEFEPEQPEVTDIPTEAVETDIAAAEPAVESSDAEQELPADVHLTEDGGYTVDGVEGFEFANLNEALQFSEAPQPQNDSPEDGLDSADVDEQLAVNPEKITEAELERDDTFSIQNIRDGVEQKLEKFNDDFGTNIDTGTLIAAAQGLSAALGGDEADGPSEEELAAGGIIVPEPVYEEVVLADGSTAELPSDFNIDLSGVQEVDKDGLAGQVDISDEQLAANIENDDLGRA